MKNAEVKESLRKNEDKMTLRFNTCLVLIKDIEHIVKSAIETWKNFYHLHNPIDFPVTMNDDEDEEEKDEKEIFEETTHFDNEEVEEDKEEEATEEDKENDEETNPMKITSIVIASLPHSPSKPVATSSLETSSTFLIVTTTGTSNIQSLFSPT